VAAARRHPWRRVSTAPGRLVAVVAVLACSLLVPAAAQADRSFTVRFSANDTGNIAIAAAPLLACSTTGTNGADCAAARNFDATSTPSRADNNSFTMVNVDTDGDPATTVNSSTATLAVPDGATVLFAGLYWGADTSAGGNGGAAPAPGTSAGTIKFRAPGQAYTVLTAAVTDFGVGTNVFTPRYQSFVDVTVQVAAAGGGTYAAGDVSAGTGGDHYAGWSLVVAYRDAAQPARNLTVFDGFATKGIGAPATTIPVSGFQTPAAGPVRTTLGFVAYEGDLLSSMDSVSLNATTLSNSANQATNFFNGSISNEGVQVLSRDPAYTNTMGYDSDLVNADGILANNATSAAIGVSPGRDSVLLGVITFATELFAPQVSLAKVASNLTHPGGPDQRGDVLRYTVTARNTGGDGADYFILSDAIPAGTTYVPGALRIANAAVTDADGDDTGEFAAGANQVVARLGTGANATLGGRLSPGASVPVSFDVRIGAVPPRFEVVNAAASTFITQSLRVPVTAESDPVTNVAAAPDLSMTKAHTPEFVAGGMSRLRLVVSNVGNLPSDGSQVTVTDPMPAAFASFANPEGDGWNCGVSGRTVTCTRSGALVDGASFPPIFVDVTISDPAPPSIVNTATLSGGGDANPDNNTATDVGGSAQQADLELTKTATPTTVLSGQTVRFTLTVLNAGPSTAQAVTVNDPLGAGYADVVATPSAGTCTTAVSCSLGDLARGESATITIDATVTANATTLTNTATVSSLTPDPAPANNSDSASIIVPATADLRLTKTPSTTSPTPGQPGGLTYTIVATNAGPSAATGVVIRDGLPADFAPTAIAGPAGFSCATTGAAVVCSGGTIAAGASATLTVTGTVAANPASLTLINSADVRADTADPDLANNADRVTIDAQPQADIGVTTTWGTAADPFEPLSVTAPNSDVRARIRIFNFGPTQATGAVLRLPLPAGATFVSSDQPATCNGAGNVITCNVGSLAPGAEFTVFANVHVALSAAGTTLTNTVTGSADQPDPVPSDNTASERLAVGTAADLVMSKRAMPTSASVGENVTYTLTVSNNGPSDAAAVEITDTLPAGVTFVSSSPGCTPAGGTVTCAIGTLATGATRESTVVVRVLREAAGTTLRSSATVTSTTQDPELADDTDAAAVVVAPESDLSITKRAAASVVPLFTDVTYTFTVKNAGPNDATGVSITDAVPAGMLFVSADPLCAFDAATRSVACQIGDLPSGEPPREVTVTLRPQTPNSGQTLVNTARVTGDQDDPSPGNNSSDASIFVPPEADLAIAKTASPATVVAGGTLTYRLVVTNAGPSTATNVSVDDRLPAAATPVTANASQGSCAIAGARVTCTLGDLPARGRAEVTITVTVAASAVGTTLVNTATVDGATADPLHHDNTASVSTPVTAPQPGRGAPEPPGKPEPADRGDLPCTASGIALVQVRREHRRVSLAGLARRAMAGQSVTIRARGHIVARATVSTTGVFAASAPLPPAGRRARIRYRAFLAGDASRAVKLTRRMIVSSTRLDGDQIVITGRLVAPLARPPHAISVWTLGPCGRKQRAGTLRPGRAGRYVARLPAPAGPALYRLQAVVRARGGGRTLYPTFTLLVNAPSSRLAGL
jgi:uncharacterized repeat protein (TIGR01451 family)